MKILSTTKSFRRKAMFFPLRITLLIFLFVLSATLNNCRSKEDDSGPTNYPVEDGSVQKLIAGKGYGQFEAAENYEMGVKFTSAYKGKITKIYLNVGFKDSYLVTLWKVSDKSIVASKYVTCTSTTNFSSVDQDIPIEPDTEYIISVNSSNYYYVNSTTALYPFTNGSITLLEYYFHIGRSQVFPETLNGNDKKSLHGYVDFNFQRTE